MNENKETKFLSAKTYFSGFELAHDTYNGLSSASDGKIYYVLSSESLEKGGQLYCFDPLTETITFLADLTEACGEAGLNAIPQGKSHVEFYETDGKLYFGTHVGVYEVIQGMERMPEHPPNGIGLYPGGHFLAWDIKNGQMEDLAILPKGEGVLSMVMDTDRKLIFAITWPYGNFISFDIESGVLDSHGPVSSNGEAGIPGRDYRVLCRSLLLDPDTGYVYFSNAEGDILMFRPDQDRHVEKLDDVHLRLDYFGHFDPKFPGNMGYNWRKIFWHAPEKVAYGIHGNSGYLFRFDPKSQNLELVERICSMPSMKSGMFDQFSYGYLGFKLGPDGETIYYLTGGPIYREGKILQGEAKIAKGGAKGLENLHLVTYHIPSKNYRDHGPIVYTDGQIPTYVNAIAIDKAGSVYTLARMDKGFGVIEDLVKIEGSQIK